MNENGCMMSFFSEIRQKKIYYEEVVTRCLEIQFQWRIKRWIFSGRSRK